MGRQPVKSGKEILAYELTSLVHGEEEAKKAQESARALFAGGAAAEMPTAELSDADLSDGSIDLLSTYRNPASARHVLRREET